MKKIIVTLICISLFISCSSDDSNGTSVETKEFRFSSTQFEMVGEVHNASLNGAIAYVKEMKGEINSEHELMNYLENYYEEVKSSSEYPELLLNLVGDSNELDLSKPNFFASIDNTMVGRRSGDQELIDLENKIYKNIQNYLDQLNNVVSSSNVNMDDIIAIEKEADSDITLDNSDLYVLFNATAVAKSSSEYWNKNTEQWTDIIVDNVNSELKLIANVDNYNSKKLSRGWGTRIIGADVAGAVTGAVYTWWVNGVPGAGQLAYGTIIGATSAGASAGAATLELWNAIF